MKQKNDGGPAFPNSVPLDFQWAENGMTLRDYFAAKALQGLVAREGHLYLKEKAKQAWALADAMIETRDKE